MNSPLRVGLVVAAVNALRRRRAGRPAPAAAIRTAIPGSERERFDVLLADARSSYALRDDDVGVCWNWPLGLVRRAGLEIGGRLTDRELLSDPRHVFEADTGAALALLSGDGLQSGEAPEAELARRWDVRARSALEEPPLHLDGGQEHPATVEVPPTVARLSEIRNAVWKVAPPRVDAPLHGLGIGSEVAVGPARLVRHPEELIRLVEGDVLVAVTTTTAFNAVFPLLAAVVTEEGGLFSHTAILARELGLPAVVGVPAVLDAVHDGDLIEVDPVVGAVRIVKAAH